MRTLIGAFICVTGAAALASCGGGGAKGCPAGGSGAEPAPRQVAVDAGVPLEDFPHALAVARCNYWGRCSGLATYVVNECVDSLTNGTGWAYQICVAAPAVSCATSYFFYAYPSAALLAAAGSGAAHYDPAGAGRCIAALLAEGCADRQLVEELPACAGVFTCPSGADGGAPPPVGADGGAACATLLADTAPFTTCATDADCVGLTAYPQGPHCVGGLCVAYPCGISGYGCTSFAQTGDPCDSNAPSLDSNQTLTATATCAPGLACVGAGVDDGGGGSCVVPQDVGGACAHSSTCKPGLVCACGACEIPPSTGPCVDSLCEVGVAYCDFETNVCRPVHGVGGDCGDDALNACGPGLGCGESGTCETVPFQ